MPLFNQNSGLFGNTQQSQQPSGLFGNMQQNQPIGIQQPQQQGSLFGNQVQTPSLFGNQMTGQQQTSQGLFGAVVGQQPQPNQSLFGQTSGFLSGNQNPSQVTGIFGQQPQQPQQTSLFGGLQSANSTMNPGLGSGLGQNPVGLFGQQSQQQGIGTSLFGGTNPAQQTLNMAQPQQQPQSSLFGQQTTTSFTQVQQPQQSSLFGGAQSQSQNFAFGNTTSTQLNGLMSFGGVQQPQQGVQIGTSFMGQQNNTFASGLQQTQYNNSFNVKFDKHQAFIHLNDKTGRQAAKTLCHAINTINQLRGLSLVEIRANDYELIKQNKLTMEVQQLLLRVKSGQSSQVLGQQMGQQNTQTSIFGGTNLSGGIFGQTNPPANQGVGLFGATSQNPPQQQVTSIFGAQQNQPQQQGLFGNLTNNNQSNLLSTINSTQNQTPQQSGGLFGTQPTQTQSQPQQGLFGLNSTGLNNNQQAQIGQNPIGGLFQQPATTNSLFGTANSAQPQTSSLFGAQVSVAQGSLFQNAAPAQQTAQFGQQQPQVQSVKIINQINQQLNNPAQPYCIVPITNAFLNQLMVDNFKPGKVDWEELAKNFKPQSMQELPDCVWLQQPRIETKLEQKHDSVIFSQYRPQQKMSQNSSQKTKPVIQEQSITKPQKKELDLSKMTHTPSVESFKNNDADIIDSMCLTKGLLECHVNFTIKAQLPVRTILKLKVNEEETVKDFKYLILQQLFGSKQEILDNMENFKIMWIPKKAPQIILNERNQICDYEMQKDEEIEVKNQKQELASEEELPILTKKGYVISPSLQKLARMTNQQLSRVSIFMKVEDFSIENDHVRIQWVVPVDLREVNLDKSVQLSWRCVELYPDDDDEKPNVGEKLNQPAVITFFNFKVKDSQIDYEKFMKKLQKWIRKNDMLFINYDPEDEVLTVSVQHF